MKKIFFAATCLFFLNTYGQDSTAAFNGKQWDAPYHLDIPGGWDVERFLIPISFAPAITYKGVEDIRFTPGWAKRTSNEYWSYAFLWYLEGEQNFTKGTIEKNLTAYYSGLFKINTRDTVKSMPAKVDIRTAPVQNGDLKTFKGTVYMPDYMTKKPILLNLLIHIKTCAGQNKTYVFYEVSPQPYSNAVWNSLHQLWLNFKCSKE
jgi:hypothetical protein